MPLIPRLLVRVVRISARCLVVSYSPMFLSQFICSRRSSVHQGKGRLHSKSQREVRIVYLLRSFIKDDLKFLFYCVLDGKSVYPSAVEELYQVEGSASSASGELDANRSTRSGLLMKGRPKAIISA